MADNPPSEKVFVGDVPVGTDENTLRQVFGVYGHVADVKALPPRAPGTKGAALVRFETLDAAQWVVENINGNVPQGMSEPVYVTFAKMNKSWGGGGGGGDYYGGGYGKAFNASSGAFNLAVSPYEGGAKGSGHPGAGPPASEKLFIGDVPVGMDESSFQRVMSKYGNVVDVKMLPARAPGEKGSALLRYSTVEEAQWVVENLNGNIPETLSEPLYITFARNTGRGGGSSASSAVHRRPVDTWATTTETVARLAAQAPGLAAFLGPFKAALENAGWKGGALENAAWKGGALGGGGGARPAQAVHGKGGHERRDWGPSSNDIHEVVRGIFRSGELPGSGKKPDSNTIQVTNLPSNTADLELYKLFATFGAIAVNGVKAMLNEDGSCRGIGFVDYVEQASASLAINTLNGTVLPDGSRLGVAMRPPSKAKYKGS